ncbi:hypothetical protein [Aliiroseovarius crassostreae]|nr:hypothetical protein [Aliiroseovarius crassostreae]
MDRDAIIQKTSKALFVFGIGAWLISPEVGGAMTLIAAGLYVYRPY